MRGHRIGYVRVSSFDQNPERQYYVPLETNCRNFEPCDPAIA